MKKQLLLGLVAIGFSGVAISQTYTFTNAGASGRYGPLQTDVNTAYTGTSLDGAVTVTTQGIQEWVVPQTGNYLITAVGACGGEGQGTYYPGLPGTGATISGEFILTAGTTLKIVVGQKGTYGDNGSGGGGGSFAFTGAPGGGGLLIAAGGGGGHGHGTASVPTGAHGGGGSADQNQVSGAFGNGDGGSPGPGMGGNAGIGAGCGGGGLGAGGAGWTTDGGSPSGCGTATGGLYMTFEGGYGGTDGLHGGFGGGGGADGNGSPGGGGGGYTGGGGGNEWTGSAWGSGAGAGSYNGGNNPVNTAGVTGASGGYTHGSVEITMLCDPINPTATADTVCQFGALTLSATSMNGGTLTWDLGAQNGVEFYPDTLGLVTYTVTSSDANDCGGTVDVFFKESPVFTVSSTDELFANDGTAAVSLVSGMFPFTYDWDNDGTGDFDDPQVLSGLAAGTYTVEVMHANGCSHTQSVIVGSQVGIEEGYSEDFMIYPNPVENGQFTIAFPNADDYEVAVYDITGKEVLHVNDASNAQNTINTSQLEAGTYTISIRQDGMTAVKTIVIL